MLDASDKCLHEILGLNYFRPSVIILLKCAQCGITFHYFVNIIQEGIVFFLLCLRAAHHALRVSGVKAALPSLLPPICSP